MKKLSTVFIGMVLVIGNLFPNSAVLAQSEDVYEEYSPVEYPICNDILMEKDEICVGHFQDIDSWTSEYYLYEYLAEKGIFKGNEKGEFGEYNQLTRAELLKVAYKAKGVTPQFDANFTFPDVQETDWFAPFVSQALKDEVVKGKSDGLFHPHDAVTFAEAMKIIFTILSITPEYTDDGIDWGLEDPNHWVIPYIRSAKKHHVLNQLDYYDYVDPFEPLLRKDSAAMLFRISVMRDAGEDAYRASLFHNGKMKHYTTEYVDAPLAMDFDYPAYMNADTIYKEDLDVLLQSHSFKDIAESPLYMSDMTPEYKKAFKNLATLLDDFQSTLQDMSEKMPFSEITKLELHDYNSQNIPMTLMLSKGDRESVKKNYEESFKGILKFLKSVTDPKYLESFSVLAGEAGEGNVSEGIQKLQDIVSLFEKTPLTISFGEPVMFGDLTFVPIENSLKEVMPEIFDMIRGAQFNGSPYLGVLELASTQMPYLYESKDPKATMVVSGIDLKNPDHITMLSTLRIQ